MHKFRVEVLNPTFLLYVLLLRHIGNLVTTCTYRFGLCVISLLYLLTYLLAYLLTY